MIQEILAVKKEQIDKKLSDILVPLNPAHQVLYESMRYSLMADGKRIRPCLFLLLLDILGNNSDLYINVASAIECIHTYSLIHDDLPGMDNDDYRRGKLTNHKVYGVGVAMMAGDGLLTYAFELVANERNLPINIRIELIKILSMAAGPAGMVGGQAHDKTVEGKSLSLRELMFLDECKTGKLFCASLEMAAEIAEVSTQDKKAIYEYGKHMGLLFQITDDLLDMEGSLAEMGKAPLQDIFENKSTYVTVLGKEQARKKAEEEAFFAIESLNHFGKEFNPLRELADFILSRKK